MRLTILVWDMITRSVGEIKRFIEPDSPEESALKALVDNLASPLSTELRASSKPGDSNDAIRLQCYWQA
jgi:hypothetical protein